MDAVCPRLDWLFFATSPYPTASHYGVLDQVEAAAGVSERGRPVLSLAEIKRMNRPEESDEEEGTGPFGGMFDDDDDDDDDGDDQEEFREEEEEEESPAALSAAHGIGTHHVDPVSLLPEYALEVQVPWSRRLLDGSKTIETRAYPLPAAVLGRPVLLIESPEGGGLAVHGLGAGRAVGTVVFGSSRRYSTQEEWAADAPRHGVDSAAPPDAFGWQEGEGREKWGWGVASVDAWPAERCRAFPLREEQRLHRSVFRLYDVK